MDPRGLALGTLLFHILILLGTCVFINAKETNAPQAQSMGSHNPQGDDVDAIQVQEKQKMHHHSHSPSNNVMKLMEPGLRVFFLMEDLKLGKKTSMSLDYDDQNSNPLSSPHLLSTKKEAEAIPFSLKQLPDILHHFSIPQGSRKARVMENTLRECEYMPIKGETKFCATSYESLVDSAREILGFGNDIQVLSTKIFENPIKSTNAGEVPEYTIVQIPQQIAVPRTVNCHAMAYPYGVIYCHSQEGGTRLYRISLEDENGGKVEAIAVCHMDTSQWERDHVSFQVLGIKPGTAPVCHFLPTNSFVLVPSTSTSI